MVQRPLYCYRCWWRTFHRDPGPSQLSQHLSHLSHIRSPPLHWIWHNLIPFMSLRRTHPCHNQQGWWRILYWSYPWHLEMQSWISIPYSLVRLWSRTWQVVTWIWTAKLWNIGHLAGLSKWIYFILDRFFSSLPASSFFPQGFDAPGVWIILTLLTNFSFSFSFAFNVIFFFRTGEGVVLGLPHWVFVWHWCLHYLVSITLLACSHTLSLSYHHIPCISSLHTCTLPSHISRIIYAVNFCWLSLWVLSILLTQDRFPSCIISFDFWFDLICFHFLFFFTPLSYSSLYIIAADFILLLPWIGEWRGFPAWTDL